MGQLSRFLSKMSIVISSVSTNWELDKMISWFPFRIKISLILGGKSANDTCEWHSNNPMIFWNVSIYINGLLVYSLKVNKLPLQYKLAKGHLSFWYFVLPVSIHHLSSIYCKFCHILVYEVTKKKVALYGQEIRSDIPFSICTGYSTLMLWEALFLTHYKKNRFCI